MSPGGARRLLPRSLRLRLIAVFAVAMAAVLAVLAVFLHRWLAAQLLSEIDRSLGTQAAILLEDPEGMDLAGNGRFVDPDEAFAQLLTPAGRVLQSSRGLGSTPVLPGELTTTLATGNQPAYLTRPAVPPDADHDRDRLLASAVTVRGQPAVLVVGQTLADRDEALARQTRLLALALPAALVVTVAAGWLLAGAALRPVESMRRRAAELSTHDPAARLPVPATGDELTRLGLTLNDLLDRLQQALEREHRFVDDASHELRTPLAVLKAELDLALARPRSPDELRRALAVAAGRTDELARLAEDLLVLARVRGGRLPLHREPTPVRPMLERAVEPLCPQAAAAGRTITVRAPDVAVEIDPLRTRQAVLNMVDNALRHGRGTVAVSATLAGAALAIEVADEGAGFPADVAGDAFEPFVRGERTPEGHQGAGLGLAIVAAVAAAHGGTARETRGQTGGAVVRLELAVRAGTDAVPLTP